MLVLTKLDSLKRADKFFGLNAIRLINIFLRNECQTIQNWFLNHYVNDLEEGSVTVTENTNHDSIILSKFPSANSLLTG
jgi:hypothetical protein